MTGAKPPAAASNQVHKMRTELVPELSNVGLKIDSSTAASGGPRLNDDLQICWMSAEE